MKDGGEETWERIPKLHCIRWELVEDLCVETTTHIIVDYLGEAALLRYETQRTALYPQQPKNVLPGYQNEATHGGLHCHIREEKGGIARQVGMVAILERATEEIRIHVNVCGNGVTMSAEVADNIHY